MFADSTANLAPSPAMDDAHYAALKAKDARFDGQFFTGVTSTGIYCRPVCRVRTPQQANCRLFTLAAQAESAGFRPCLRCRPELAPAGLHRAGQLPWSSQDASAILARQAALRLDNPDNWRDQALTMAQLAEKMGISPRHLRRIFETQWGISPLQYLQTRRLLTAKQLLTDTTLAVSQVARLSGFTSVRRFNASFADHYRMEPRALRKAGAASSADPAHSLLLKAAYRPPYDVAGVLQFFATRSIAGVEVVDLQRQTLARTLTLDAGGHHYSGWVQLQFMPTHSGVNVRVSESLADVLPTVLARVKALLDLDADPLAIADVLAPHFPGSDGVRVPGTLDGFELGVRAILGQQITVRAAQTLAARLVDRFGTALTTPIAGLTRLFPTPQALAQASGDALGQLGIVRQRQRAIVALAQAVSQGNLALHAGAPVPATLAALQALPGIGAWTAHYIAMRALRWPDAFPAGDVALQRALGVREDPHPAQAAEQASQVWRPWRSYAVLRAWNRLTIAIN
jgi:AraC family transcriptional regulator of adaptative response / DNA-3-methyladenine glycosylase II